MGALCIATVLCVFAFLDGDHITTLCDDNPVIDLPCDEFGLKEAFIAHLLPPCHPQCLRCKRYPFADDHQNPLAKQKGSPRTASALVFKKEFIPIRWSALRRKDWWKVVPKEVQPRSSSENEVPSTRVGSDGFLGHASLLTTSRCIMR
jgi:hypothetical protein